MGQNNITLEEMTEFIEKNKEHKHLLDNLTNKNTRVYKLLTISIYNFDKEVPAEEFERIIGKDRYTLFDSVLNLSNKFKDDERYVFLANLFTTKNGKVKLTYKPVKQKSENSKIRTFNGSSSYNQNP